VAATDGEDDDDGDVGGNDCVLSDGDDEDGVCACRLLEGWLLLL
jgi:hypothetical protein